MAEKEKMLLNHLAEAFGLTITSDQLKKAQFKGQSVVSYTSADESKSVTLLRCYLITNVTLFFLNIRDNFHEIITIPVRLIIKIPVTWDNIYKYQTVLNARTVIRVSVLRQ